MSEGIPAWVRVDQECVYCGLCEKEGARRTDAGLPDFMLHAYSLYDMTRGSQVVRAIERFARFHPARCIAKKKERLIRERVARSLEKAHKTVAPLVEQERLADRGISAEVAAIRFK